MAMEQLKDLYTQYYGVQPTSVQPLTAAGSGRQYYRLQAGGSALVGVVGESVEENRAFIALSHHLSNAGIPVPRVVAVSDDMLRYLQTDLGNTSLYDALATCRKSGEWNEEAYKLLSNTMHTLARTQVEGDRGLDYSVCYPTASFDERSIMYDLNYFKYCFLKAVGVSFHENRLQDDMELMTAHLLTAEPKGLLYRDFQSRNVMVCDAKPYFIDFQGARYGAVHYDVASFLWQARAQYPAELRQRLVQEYITALRNYYPELDGNNFAETLNLYVLFRTLQVLGAYGFRGYFERKELFLQSIPQAIENLRDLLAQGIASPYPHLQATLQAVCDLSCYQPVEVRTHLRVTVYSFSYKKGLPGDDSGNGGGFVFDCRATHNPGRYDAYKQLTGLDDAVKDFLEKDSEILTFLDHAYALVDSSVERYLERGFTNLQVSFGCTGGQHRSVYSAQAMAEHLHKKYNVEVLLIHRERNITQLFSAK
ncbi:MAG: phosphotransferase [Bacteroidaceae bacterium]|nr:phosphotransferase [Bacteroidaceae bacterium]